MTAPSSLTQSLIRCIDDFYHALAYQGRPIELYMPHFDGSDAQALSEVLSCGWVAMGGDAVSMFETTIADYLGVNYAIATVNATAALHLSLLLSEVGPNDAVITQSNTFISPANAIRYCGAEPIFVDINPDDLGMSADALGQFLAEETIMTEGTCTHKRSGLRIRAVLPVHVLGHPVDMLQIRALASQYNLRVIEDAAEALGSGIWVDGQLKRCGSWGHLSVLSFNANKLLTTGAGGMLLTDDLTLAKRARHLATLAKSPTEQRNEFEAVGYNYGMPNLNAALGLAQWRKWDMLWTAKQALTLHYADAIEPFPEARLVVGRPDAVPNFWMNAVIFDEADRAAEALGTLRSHGILARGLWQPLHESIPYRECFRGPLPNTQSLIPRTVQLPSGIPSSHHRIDYYP